MIITSHEIDTDGQRHYRLVPLASTTCRAAESRLLEVGHAMGAEVTRIGDSVPAVVVKRFVVKGERWYCVKDTFGIETVKEKDLQRHVGGTFPFVVNFLGGNR